MLAKQDWPNWKAKSRPQGGQAPSSRIEKAMSRHITFLLLFVPLAVNAITQRDVVAATLVLEAGGEGAYGMKAVQCVIQNRARATHETFYAVVRRPYQFSVTTGRSNETLVTLAKRHVRWPEALRIATGVQGDITNGAMFYLERSLVDGTLRTPSWAKRMNVTLRIGRHIFLCEQNIKSKRKSKR